MSTSVMSPATHIRRMRASGPVWTGSAPQVVALPRQRSPASMASWTIAGLFGISVFGLALSPWLLSRHPIEVFAVLPLSIVASVWFTALLGLVFTAPVHTD